MKPKKLLSTLLVVLLIVSTMPMAFAASTSAGGIVGSTDSNVTIENASNSGSVMPYAATEPSTTIIDGKTFYQLDSADDLYWFAEQVNVNKIYDINAVLTADIVINEDLWSKITVAEDGTATVNEGETVTSWTPIRYFTTSDSVGYEGIFDGANHTISGLYINTGDDYQGLFALAKEATIKNLGIVDSYFYGDDNVAPLVANARNTTISNCFSENCLIVNQGNRVGGLASCLADNSNISGCYNASDIKSLDSYAGGIAGEISITTTVRDCFNTGDIEVKTNNWYLGVGGIVGIVNTRDSVIENCYNVGNISSNATNGGIAGKYGTIINCYYNSDVFSGNVVNNGYTVISSEGKTTQQFASGEVAYALGSAWGQKIGTDPYPVLGSTDTVYRVATYTKCDMSDVPVCEYNNTSGSDINNAPQHILTGEVICIGQLCEVCGKYCGEADESKHVLSWKTAKEATCTEPGWDVCYCEVCGNIPAIETVLCDSATYPESEHDYPGWANEEYEFSYPGATKLVITFSEDTETENKFDFIYIYDSTGAEYGKYTGTELAGAQIELEGSSFKIKLTSDGSANRYGFRLESVYATTPTAEYQRETAAVGHSIQSVEAQSATCTEIGWDAYEYCTACDYTTYAEIASTGHSFTVYTKSEDAKCGVNEKETATCDNGCGATDIREIAGTALEHSYDYTKSEDNLTRPTQNADGTWNDGYYTYTCLNGCGSAETETVKRADYTEFDEAQVQFNNYVRNYNLTDEAINAAMQRMMNFTIENGEIDKNLIESEQELIDKAVVLCNEIFAEFEAGIADGTIVKADYTEIDEVIAEIDTALENATISDEMAAQLADIKTDLASLKEDVNSSKADVAELLETAEEIKEAMDNCANGVHSFTAYTKSADATCLANEKETANCDNGCGATDTREIAGTALGHDIVTDKAVAATCTETGLAEGSHCSRCDDMTVAQEVTPALGHDIVTDEAVAATCTETGLTEGSHCSRCDDMTVAQEVIPAIDHADEDGDGICDIGGEQVGCEYCGRPAHEGFFNDIICLIIQFINLVKSIFA